MALRLALTDGPRTEAWERSVISLEGRRRFVIGRNEQSDLVLQDAAKLISSRHCEIVLSGDDYTLCDMSTNGTFVNGAKERLSDVHRLADGDTIAIGPYVLRASLAASEVPPPERVDAGQGETTRTALHRPAAQRGGDPAEMIAKAAPLAGDAWLNSSGEEDIASAGFTVILPAPRKQPDSAAPAAQSAPAQTVSELVPKLARAPEPAGQPDPGDIVARMASGLGVPLSAFEGMEPGDVAERLGGIARGLSAGARTLLDDATRARREIGSRQFGIRRDPQDSPLKFSPSVQDALLALLAMPPDAADRAIERSATEIGAHQRKLLAAAQDAARTLSEDLDPRTLSGAVAGVPSGIEAKARLWDIYGILWGGLDPDWAASFVEVFRLRMASAYDAEGPDTHAG